VSTDLLLTADIGTSGCKAAVYSRNLELIATAQHGYRTHYAAGSRAEQNPRDWWDAFRACVGDLVSDDSVESRAIVGVGIDGMSSTMCALDSAGNEVGPALIWLDRRAAEEGRSLKDAHAERWKHINGNRPDASGLGPKLMWLAGNQPDLYERIDSVVLPNGYVGYRLTGRLSMDRSQGGLTGLFDLNRGDWSEELIGVCGLEASIFPEVFESTAVIGGVSEDAARETGIAAGTPVIAGMMDNVAAGLGAGVRTPGQLYVGAGTATNAGACVAHPTEQDRLLQYHHGLPDRVLLMGGVDYGGAGVRWFSELLALAPEELDRIVTTGSTPEEPMLFLPYMIGQRAPLWNDHSRGVLAGISPVSTREDVLRALMEGNAFGTRLTLELVQEAISGADEKGFGKSELRMTGGCTQSRAWTQIFADILGREVAIPGEKDVSTMGCAIAVLIGLGIDSEAEVTARIPISARYEPDPERAAYYDELYRAYLRLYESIQPTYEALARS
jgi:sugar (pentulose or hexulose) kinase